MLSPLIVKTLLALSIYSMMRRPIPSSMVENLIDSMVSSISSSDQPIYLLPHKFELLEKNLPSFDRQITHLSILYNPIKVFASRRVTRSSPVQITVKEEGDEEVEGDTQIISVKFNSSNLLLVSNAKIIYEKKVNDLLLSQPLELPRFGEVLAYVEVAIESLTFTIQLTPDINFNSGSDSESDSDKRPVGYWKLNTTVEEFTFGQIRTFAGEKVMLPSVIISNHLTTNSNEVLRKFLHEYTTIYAKYLLDDYM